MCLHQLRPKFGKKGSGTPSKGSGTPSKGPGAGQRGRGGGNSAEGGTTPAAIEKTLIRGKISSHQIVGKRLVRSLPTQGKALVEYRSTHEAVRSAAASALSRQRIPANYRNLVRSYFDSIAPESQDGLELTKPAKREDPDRR